MDYELLKDPTLILCGIELGLSLRKAELAGVAKGGVQVSEGEGVVKAS